MQDDDEILEAYEQELGGTNGPGRKRGFPVVIGVLGLSCVFLLVEIFANRSIPNDIGTAQHDLRVAQAAATRVFAGTGSYATADSDGLNATVGDVEGIDYVAADEPSGSLRQVSVYTNGVTWSAAVYTDIPNPGASMEAIALREGLWALIYNDTEKGRHSLQIALSEDEGTSWKWRRHLERDTSEQNRGSYHYPSMIQARDGTLHATYSYTQSGVKRGEPSQSIKHAHFNIEWVKQGDRVRR